MNSVFDMSEEYRKSRAQEYTQAHLIKVLELSKVDNSASYYEYTAARKRCQGLLPISHKKEKSPEEKLSEGKFKYLQFLYYMIMKDRECKANGFSVFDSIEHPSQRYYSLYTEMIGEIWGKVSEPARELVEGVSVVQPELSPSDRGWYDDSIHELQQLCDLISATLCSAYNYGPHTLRMLERQEHLFYEKMEYLKNQPHPQFHIMSWWDELYFRLHYARCLYWEKDLLEAYQEIQKIALKPPSKFKYSNMQEEICRKLVPEDNCFLILNNATNQIEEIQGIPVETADTPLNTSLYISALEKYIKRYAQEIAQKTFCIQNVTQSEISKIINRIPKICEYLKIEFQRYNRNSLFSKAKLISAYQVFFMSLPGSGIAPNKAGTTKAETPSGSRREKNTISASYSNSSEKEPLYLQYICIWTDYQFLWNSVGSLFAQKYLETNISALEAMLSVGYQSGMADIQIHTEKILFAAMETLIPDEDGKEQLKKCVGMLSEQDRKVKVDNFSSESLLTFGKFCKLFDYPKIIFAIKKTLETEERKPLYLIPLELATDYAFRVHSLELQIYYDEVNKVYVLHDFKLINIRYFNLINNIGCVKNDAQKDLQSSEG